MKEKPPSSFGLEQVNQGQDDEMGIVGYRRDTLRTVLTCVGYVLTLGFLRLVFYWLPHRMIQAMYRVASLDEAEVVVLKDQYEQYFVSYVKTCDKHGNELKDTNHDALPPKTASTQNQVYTGDVAKIRYFISKKVKYVWNDEYSQFQQVSGLGEGLSCAFFHEAGYLTRDEQVLRQIYYGLNSIQIHLTPIIKILFKQVLSPFYIFQVFSCTLWFYDEYIWYASCIVLISIVSITATIYETRKMQRALRNTIDSSTIVTVCRGENDYHEISSEDLVPGDIIEIPRGGCMMQCDAVLVSGNCIVNESMLTGESVPVTKTPLPNPRMTHEDSAVLFNKKDHSRHVLFSGTQVLQTRYYGGQKVRAVVYRTGFSTSKGELVRSILYPKPVDFQFNKDTYKFVGILAGVALCGFVFTIILMVNRDEYVVDIVVRSLDLITIAVPPALPAALTVGIVFAQRRLKLARIFCISPRSINVCGSINTVCFDKTGTLTEEGLDMHSIASASAGKFDKPIKNMDLLPRGHFMTGMATCHSLTIIDGVLSGDPLELIMFDSIRWELIEPGPEDTHFDSICPVIVHPKGSQRPSPDQLSSGLNVSSDEVGIVRQFTFSSSLQRMSVVVRKLGGDNFDIYTKGAPEMIASLCTPDSVPDDFQEVLMEYTKHGYRVLALAHKQLPSKLKYTKIQRIQREQVERGLTFLGLIVMENRLKPVSTTTIVGLKDANIRTIMVTGDNMLTALSVARECHMVQPREPIVLVQAFPAQTDGDGNITEAAHVEYIYTDAPDEAHNNFGSSGEKINKLHENLFTPLDPELGMKTPYHFAVTGKSWSVINKHFPEILDKIAVRGTVFARMLPDQKAQLIETLQDMGYYVGMCGDGANDCGALKTAHAGISLSEAEASVASPFTSKTADISCVPTVIREGRTALVTSVGVFKYMACYSLTQFTSVILLYLVGVNLTDFEFLYIDLFLITTLGITFGYTGAYHKLSRDPPQISLLCLAPILSFFLQTVLVVIHQVFFYFIIQEASWFVPYDDVEGEDYEAGYDCYENSAVFIISMFQYIYLAVVFVPYEDVEGEDYEAGYDCYENSAVFIISMYQYIILAVVFVPYEDVEGEDYEAGYDCYENSAVFIISMYQYIILAVVFAKGKPYRKSMFTNHVFILNLAVVVGVTLWINIYPTEPVAEFLELMLIPSVSYRLIFIGAACVNLLLALMLETFILDSRFVSVKLQEKLDRCLPGSRPKHDEVSRYLASTNSWPPVRSGDLVSTFQRLDSAHQAVSINNDRQADTDSLLSSDADSITGVENRQSAQLNTDSIDVHMTGPAHHSNPAFNMEIAEPGDSSKPGLSTKL